MNKKLVKEILKEVKEKYPEIQNIEISYSGSGDSFGDFYNHDITYYSDMSLPNEDQVFKKVFDLLQDPIWELMETMNCDFNNDGCEGTIIIDLENLTINGDRYDIVTTTEFGTSADYFD